MEYRSLERERWRDLELMLELELEYDVGRDNGGLEDGSTNLTLTGRIPEERKESV